MKAPNIAVSTAGTLVKKKRQAITSGVVAVVAILTVGTLLAYNNASSHTNTLKVAQQPRETVVTEQTVLPEKTVLPETVATEPEIGATPQSMSPKTETAIKSQPAPAPAAPAKPAPQPVFMVQAIRVFRLPYYSCDQYGEWLTFPAASITLSANSSGVMQWQIEKKVAGAAVVVSSGSNFVELNRRIYYLANDYGLFKGRRDKTEALRLHITSPNDFVSEWYIPTSATDCYGNY